MVEMADKWRGKFKGRKVLMVKKCFLGVLETEGGFIMTSFPFSGFCLIFGVKREKRKQNKFQNKIQKSFVLSLYFARPAIPLLKKKKITSLK